MKFPTGGIAHEPQGMTWCNSKADSIVWMKEEQIDAVDDRVYCMNLNFQL